MLVGGGVWVRHDKRENLFHNSSGLLHLLSHVLTDWDQSSRIFVTKKKNREESQEFM